MTKTTLKIELSCNGKTLTLGPGEELDITKITGLESSELEVGLSDLAVVDGSSLDGKHVKARPIHIEGSFRSLKDPGTKRETLVRFFNPKLSGTLTATIETGDQTETRTRSIDYELEGWTIREQKNLDARVGFVADLICPDPYFYGPEQESQGWIIEVGGDTETGWTAHISGPVTTATITNEDTGEYMRVEGVSVPSGGELQISTEERAMTVTVGGVSVFRYIDRGSTPFKLQPGYNTLDISSDISSGGYAYLTYRERFFGI